MPPRVILRRTVARALVLMLLVALVACSRTPDEQVLRETVAAMQGALESRDPKAFMAGIAEDFTGSQGSLDREGLHGMLRAQVLSNASIGVTTGPLDIAVQGDRATVTFTATFTGGEGRFLPERGSVYTITSGWRRSGDDWVCVNAQWERKL